MNDCERICEFHRCRSCGRIWLETVGNCPRCGTSAEIVRGARYAQCSDCGTLFSDGTGSFTQECPVCGALCSAGRLSDRRYCDRGIC